MSSDRGEGGRSEPPPLDYVLLSLKHSPGPKGEALWWGLNRCGYVGLDDAGRYSEVQAKAIANGHHAGHPPTCVAVPVETAVALSRRAVDWYDTKDLWPIGKEEADG